MLDQDQFREKFLSLINERMSENEKCKVFGTFQFSVLKCSPFITACTKTQNNETKPPKRNERNETTETSKTTKTKTRYDKYDTKRPKQHHRPAKDNYVTYLGL